MKVGVVGLFPPPGPVTDFVANRRWPKADGVDALLAANPEVEAILERAGLRWQARLRDHPEWSPLYVDFGLPRFSERGLRRMGRVSPFARALGIGRPRAGPALRALDATAGLGTDAFIMAWLGFETLALERDPVAFVLLADGLERAPPSEAASRLTVESFDSEEWLRSSGPSGDERPDVVYLDPMYAGQEDRTALPKKGMQLFRALVGGDPRGEEALLEAALACARMRVVVKRHPRAQALAGPRPTATFSSKSVRFDAYIRPPA